MMKNKKINMVGEWITAILRRMCGRITPDKRVAVIVTMFLLFAGLSLYFTVSSIYRFGRGDGEKLQIQHIERLKLELRQIEAEMDSIRNSSILNYEYERETE